MVKHRSFRYAGAALLRFGALATIGLLSLVVVVHFMESIRFAAESDIAIPGFIIEREWRPSEELYGASSFLRSSFRVAALAVLFSFPGSLVLALYIAEYAEEKSRRRYTAILDVMASVPTVVYGLFALMLVTPLLQLIFGVSRVQPYNTLSAGIVLGVFLTPQVTNSLARAISRSRAGVRDAALHLGATRAEALLHVVVPGALPGLLSALLLAYSRAFGESIIVGMVAGSGPRATSNPLYAAETMTGLVLRTAGTHRGTVFLIGTALFFFALVFNLLGEWVSRQSVAEELR